MGVERWSQVKKPLRIMKVEMIPLSKVKSHEKVIENEIIEFSKSLKTKGIFYRPILLDKNSLVVLDGHHRVEGLRRIGAKKIPAILLDYNDDEVGLFTWYPVIWVNRERILSFLEKHGKIENLPKEKAIEEVDNGNAYICILPDTDGIVSTVYGKEEMMLKVSDEFDVEYVDTLDFLNSIKDDKCVLLYRRIPTKEEVIERAQKNIKFPPKTTRHYLPYRYQDIRMKLSYLY